MNLREPPIRSAKYLRGSKGQTCKLRIPGVCTGDVETVIPAHIRDSHTGRGVKASDTSTADCCRACHDVFDLRAKLPSGEYLSELDWHVYALRGLQDTIESRVRRQIVIVPLDPEHLVHDRETKPRLPKDQRKAIPSRSDPWPSGRKLQSRNNMRKAQP